jgi:hypothetical protein
MMMVGTAVMVGRGATIEARSIEPGSPRSFWAQLEATSAAKLATAKLPKLITTCF